MTTISKKGRDWPIFKLNVYLKKLGQPRPLFSFGFFKQTIQYLQQIKVKKCPNVHPVYGAGI